MAGLAVLIPLGVLGLILWVVLLLTRRSSTFTISTAASFYAHLMTIVGATMTLIGVGVGLKLLFAQVNQAWAYFLPQTTNCPSGAPIQKCIQSGANVTYTGSDVSSQMRQDLVLAIVLLVIGLIVLGFHYALIRVLGTREGADNPIVIRGTLVAFTVLYGLTGLVSLATALYSVLNYALATSGSTPGPFADSLGVAVAFTPAWAYAALRLVQATRQHPPQPAAA